jgi:hypothetical protein
VGEKWLVAYARMLLGDLALDQDDYWRAISFFTESLALLREVGGQRICYRSVPGGTGVACL